MPTFTVQSIVDRAAAQADMHDNFVNTSTWLAWFNYERRALAIDMARGATVRELTFNSVPAGQADKFTLLGEFLAVVGVWEQKPDGRTRQLRYVPFENSFYQLQGGGGPIKGISQTFSIEELGTQDGINVRFFPVDPSGTYLVVTLNSPDVAVSLEDTFSLPLGLEEKIVLELAKRALIKEESDIAAIKDLLQSQEQKLEEYIWGRAFAQAPSIKNTDPTQRGWGWGWDNNFMLPTPDLWSWL